MAEERKRRRWPWVVVALLVVGSVAAYFACYMILSDGPDVTPVRTLRYFESIPTAQFFVPGAWVEAKVTGRRVELVVLDPVFREKPALDFEYSVDP